MASSITKILPNKPHWLDQRLLNVRHNDFAWRATPAKSIEEWEERRDFTRAQILLAAGLAPMPEKTPLEPEVWGKANYWGIQIRKVKFQSMPGLICTGNLYLPGKLKNPAPGILCPHGHWSEGRIHHDELGSVPLRCIMLARLGFVVFSYDMIGKCDNNQILHSWPIELQKLASLSGVSLFGLQTWNSLRALDFLCALEEVDKERIGCTGTSGGASQTWTVAVLDERIKVIAPVCMLSSHFQGGCPCEEGPLLRINGVTSFDVLTACAPRPVFLPSVDQDWTNLNPTYEIEALKQVYTLFDAEDAILNYHKNEPHNYNLDTREHVYPWFAHWLLNQSLRETIAEDPIPMPAINLLLHNEQKIEPTLDSTKTAIEEAKKFLLQDAIPEFSDQENISEYAAERIPLLGEIINNDLELADIAVRVTCPQWKLNNATAYGRLISRREEGDVIPAVWVVPDKQVPKPVTCLLISDKGKADYFKGGDQSILLDILINNNCECLAIDLLGSGETAGAPEKSPRDENDPLFFAFNQSLFSMRVQDILTSLSLLKEQGKEKIVLIASGEAARAAAVAVALAEPLKAIVLNLDGIDDSEKGWSTPLSFQPMILKVGGIKGTLSIIAPRRLIIYRPQKDLAQHLTSIYGAAKKTTALTIDNDNFIRSVEKAIR